MKQLRWIIILAAAAAVLTAVYLIVDAKARERDDKIRNTSAPKQLIYEDPSTVTRITLDNEEGHFAFDWDAEKATWVLTSSEQFPINTYAVSAICNYLCQARSLKTVAPDCENTAPFGFEHPVTLKLYTQKRDLFLEGLDRIGLKHNMPQGTYFVMLDIQAFLDLPAFRGYTDLQFCEWMIKNIGVAAVPGSSS